MIKYYLNWIVRGPEDYPTFELQGSNEMIAYVTSNQEGWVWELFFMSEDGWAHHESTCPSSAQAKFEIETILQQAGFRNLSKKLESFV